MRRQFYGRSLACIGALGTVIALANTVSRPDLHAQQSATPAAASTDGKTLYEARCANCHGLTGKGDGPAAVMLVVRPRDFTSGRFKLRSTESGSIPTDSDLIQTISVGMHGSSMPDWKPFLSDDQLRALVGYIKAFSPRFGAESPQVVSVGEAPASSPQLLEKGREAYDRLKCASCHGTDGMARDAIATDLKDDWGQPIVATRLNEPWTFRGGSTARDVYLRFRTGMNGTPMPSFKDAATDQDMWALASYVVSLARKPTWEMSAEEVQAHFRQRASDEQSDKVGRGRYLLNTLGCAFCHSPVRPDGSLVEEFKFAGGQRLSMYPFPDFVSYNLTSDRDTGLGRWSDQQIKDVLTRGVRPDGSRMFPFPMPWPSYGSLSTADLDALVAGLRSLPATSNAIPAPQDPNLVSFFWGKFRMLILHTDLPGAAFSGNAGTPRQGQSWQTASAGGQS